MPNLNQQFAEWNILRTVDLQAVATWMIRDLIRSLRQLEAEILAQVILMDPTAGRTLGAKKDRLANLLSDIKELIRTAYAEMLNRVNDFFEDIADVDNERQREQIFAIFGVKPSSRTKLAGIAGVLILGATAEDWLSRQAGDLDFRIKTALTTGFGNGEPLDVLSKRIRGTAAPDKEGGDIVVIPRPVETAERNAEVLIRTGVESISDEVTKRVAEKIPDSIRVGWQQISVLDSRTTQTCRAYAFKIWDREYKPIGHDLPFDGGCPRHWGCRSSITQILLDEDAISEFTFKDWLATISPADQEKIFGKKQMELYRAGKITDAVLIRQQQRALSPEDLRNQPDPRLPKD